MKNSDYKNYCNLKGVDFQHLTYEKLISVLFKTVAKHYTA